MAEKRKDRDVVGVAAKDIPRGNPNYPGVDIGHGNKQPANVGGHGNAQKSGTANRRGP